MRVVLFLFLILPVNLLAQAGRDAGVPAVPRFTLKINAGLLLNPGKQGLALATDVRLAPRFSADAGAGFFFNSTIFANNKGESYQGIRLRGGLKYLFGKSKYESFHVGIEGKYHDIDHRSYQDVLRQGGQYVETLLTDRRVKTSGLASRVGWYFYKGSNRRFLLEPFLGLGVIYNDVSLDLPPDAELIDEDNLFEYPPGKSRFLDVLVGLYVGYLFW